MPTVRFRQDAIHTQPYTGDGSSQCIYWDETLPCFGLRVYPNGRRSYVCSYRVNGRKRIATLGRADVLTLALARKKVRAFLGSVAEGKDPQEGDDAMRASGTVKALCDEYLKRHAKLKKRSWKTDESHLSRRVIPKLGSRLAASITTNDISRLHAAIGADAPYAANRVLEILRKMFNLARTWQRLPPGAINPAAGIEDFPETKRRRYVTAKEMPQLAAAIEAEPNDYAKHALWLLLFTGLRVNELLRAKWSDIDWEERTLFIGQTKNGESMLAPLSLAAVERLKTIPHMPENPFIICGSLAGQHLVNLTKPWTRIRKEAGMPDLRIHDLRRTVGSWLVRGGASLHLVGSVLNHKDPKTTAGYAYFQTHDRTEALDKHGLDVAKIVSAQPGVASGGKSSHLSFSREELYRMIWQEPIATVAKRLKISDVGLAKACRRSDIPIPGRGYWAKLSAGEQLDKAPLPILGNRTKSEVRIRVREEILS